ncbi:right-handed parallel beta-helix repeat-containing protein [Chryseobacterium gallinarum]|uniref:right-handed parallel beta-helix repeat-containing protein n=1 Tax=Chryseobacterium gallinarum TaxID=1324352 RepID=UPI00202447EF|nr:right-handed parallel beta-helix repeat-containing protein [Chryseobacterium gallinarum]MCL8536973.1 right-handed parallel beta-helix repeat-containing protein [Chryseobacterium gallinarum]
MTLNLVSELKTKNGSTYADFYIVKGYHAINDGGGGEFYWDGTYLGNGNEGTIIAANEGGVTIGAWRRSYEGPVNLLWFGAKGDDMTDDTIAYKLAADYCSKKKEFLLVPEDKVFRISQKIKANCSITGTGTLRTTTSGAAISVELKGAVVENITIIGTGTGDNIIGGGLYVNYSENCLIRNVKVNNVQGAGITAVGSSYAHIDQCKITATRGQNGDGIIVMSASGCKITNNYCADYQRVGIVCDKDFAQSEEVYIAGNICKEGHSALGNEFNGGIWVEKTHGAQIVNNYVENHDSKGIIVVPAIEGDLTYTYLVHGNTIKNSREGINITAGKNAKVIVSDNFLFNYSKGIEVSDADTVILSNIYFGEREKQTIKDNLISIANDTQKPTNVIIQGCINDTSFDAGVSPISFPEVYGMQCIVTVRDCKGNWAYRHFSAATILGSIKYFNTLFDLDSLGYPPKTLLYLANTDNEQLFDSCEIRLPVDMDIRSQSPTVIFRNCHAEAPGYMNLIIGEYGSQKVILDNCTFKNITFLNPKTNFEAMIKNSEISNYGANGFLDAPLGQLGVLEVLNSKFVSANSAIPFNLPLNVNYSLFKGNIFKASALFSNITTMPKINDGNSPLQ